MHLITRGYRSIGMLVRVNRETIKRCFACVFFFCCPCIVLVLFFFVYEVSFFVLSYVAWLATGSIQKIDVNVLI